MPEDSGVPATMPAVGRRKAQADRRLHDAVALTDSHADQTRGVVGFFYRSYARELGSRLGRCKPRRVLDLGCGEGVLTGELGIPAVQLDVSLERLRRVDRQGAKRVCADAYSIPLADHSVDVVLMIALLEHTRSPWLVLEEACRVLVPGGAAVVLVPNDVLMSIGRVLLGKWPPRYPDHLTFITPAKLASWTTGLFCTEQELALPFRRIPYWGNMYHYAVLRKAPSHGAV